MMSRSLLALGFPGFPRCRCGFYQDPPYHHLSLTDWSHHYILPLKTKEKPIIFTVPASYHHKATLCFIIVPRTKVDNPSTSHWVSL